jgi:hypothetical protein
VQKAITLISIDEAIDEVLYFCYMCQIEVTHLPQLLCGMILLGGERVSLQGRGTTTAY